MQMIEIQGLCDRAFQRENWQHAEANDRENFERVEIGLGARLRLHRKVHAPQGLMARIGSAHARVEQIIGEARELAAQGRVVGAQMHAESVLV